MTIGVGLALLGAVALAQDTTQAVRAVAHVDLARYAGRWYEVARFPNRFQRKCTGETTAEYTLRPDGRIRVVNRCVTASGAITAEGEARRARKDGPTSMLKVRFAPRILSFLPMVWGDYWILDLADDYSAALVGSPDREYLWILSRTPTLAADVEQRMRATARRQGFDVSRLMSTAPSASR